MPGESKRAVAGVGSSSVAVAGEVDDGVGGDRIEAVSGGLDRQVEVPAQDETHQILRLGADDYRKAVVISLGEDLLHLAKGHRILGRRKELRIVAYPDPTVLRIPSFAIFQFGRMLCGMFPWLVGQYCSYLLPKQALATGKEAHNKIWLRRE